MRRLATVPTLGLAARAGMTITVPRPTVVVGPRTPGELRTARRRLLAEVRGRDRDFELVAAELTRSNGSPAVEVVGDQVLDKRRLPTRSVHVYQGRETGTPR